MRNSRRIAVSHKQTVRCAFPTFSSFQGRNQNSHKSDAQFNFYWLPAYTIRGRRLFQNHIP